MKKKITYTQIRKELKAHLDMVCDSHDPLVVERRNGENVVIISENDYSALEETAYLLRSPKNATRLIEAIKRNPKTRVKFKNLNVLKNELGI